MMQLGFDSLYHPYYFTSKLLNSNDDIVDANLKLAQNWPWFRLGKVTGFSSLENEANHGLRTYLQDTMSR